MSITDTLITNWLNKDINFEPKITNIQTDFRNGYYFGQLLLKLGLISEDDSNLYIIANKFNEIRENFFLLQKNLNDILGLKLRNEEVDDLINNYNKYNIVLLLYRIKSCYYKYKIHFSDIKISSAYISPQDLSQKLDLFIDYKNNNASIDNKKRDDKKFFTPKQDILNIKKIKLKKVSFSNQERKESEFPNEKNYIKKRILLPKIQKELHSQNQNYVIPEEDQTEKKKYLFKNKSQINILKYPPLEQVGITTKDIENKRYERNIYYNNNRLLKENKSANNMFQNKINFINNINNDLNKTNDIPIYNFVKKDKALINKILDKLKHSQNVYSYLEQNFILYDVRDNSKYKSSIKRKEYSEFHKKENEKNIIIKRLNYFNNLFHKIKISQKNIKSNSSSAILNRNLNKEEKEKFNSELFFRELDNLEYKQFLKYSEKKYKKHAKHQNKIKRIVLLIINVANEGYIYQAETKKDLIDMPFYLKLIRYFLNNKQIKRKTYIDEFRLIKEVSKIDDSLDLTGLQLGKEELFFLKDYLYFIGFWNKRKIIDSKLLGKKLEYKFLFHDKKKVEEYEPTEMEHDDLTLPTKYLNDFDFGELIYEFIEHKYSQMEQLIKNDDNEEKNQIAKWSHIKYKIAIAGKSFIFNKYIAQQINKKYPNLKIYSIHKLLHDYCSEYNKLLNEPEPKPTKTKFKKGNQDELRKKQREEKLEEFKPILNIIKPYLNQIENISKNDENKNKIDSFIIPQDDLLLKLLIYQIEKDFPIKTREEVIQEIQETNNQINNIQEKIKEIKNTIEDKNKEKEKIKGKEKNESKKDKEKISLDNLENELANIKLESIKGFILVDFPNNINQCHLLENYLTGYIDDLLKPKSLKSKEIEKFSEIIDIKHKPNKEKKLKNSGIDFLINLSLKQEQMKSLFTNIKYDPLEDIIHSKIDLDIPNDKKLNERLVDKIYYYNDKSIQYYKSEYEENIFEINLFYDKFGFYVDDKSKINNNNLPMNLEKKTDDYNPMRGIKVFQAMSFSNLYQQINSIIANLKEIKKNKKSGNTENTKFNKNTNKDKTGDDCSIPPSELYQIFTENITDFFTRRIEVLYDSINKANSQLIRSCAENENSKISEIKRIKTKKTNNMQDKDKLIYNLKSKSDELLSSILYLNEEYKTNLNKFIYLLFNQKNDIIQRFNLIQKKYREFLNRETEKKKLIHKYTLKYNHFFDLKKDALSYEDVQKEFMSDIEFVNINLWEIINLKKKESIEELNDIKNCGYIEVEMCKFCNNIKNLFLSEANKYVSTMNTLIEFYMKYYIDEKVSNMKNAVLSGTGNILNKLMSLKEEVDKNLSDIKENENSIFKDLIPFNDILKKGNEENKDNDLYDSELDYKNSRTKYNFSLGYKINLIIKNIKTLFFNSIKYMISENDIIVPFLKLLSEIDNTFKKKGSIKSRKVSILTSENSSQNIINTQSNNINTKISILSEDVFQIIIKQEKDKLKYRLCFIKDFAIKYVIIISKIFIKIFDNLDDWVIKSIQKENETQNEVVNLLKKKLKQIEKINVEMEIDSIEMDAFDKRNTSNISEKNIRPIDNSNLSTSGLYDKINIDFLKDDKFFNVQLKQKNINQTNKEDDEPNIYNDIAEEKEYEIVIPDKIKNNIDSSEFISDKNISSIEGENTRDKGFYFDLDKFFNIYKEIVAFEEEKNIISQHNFFESFIKYYIFNDNEESVKYEYNAISNNLKKLNIKQIMRLINLCKINLEKKNDEKDMEYDTYIKTPEIFTFLSLAGAPILTGVIEDNILEHFKDKFFDGGYVTKNEFMQFNFWFEKYFEFQKDKNKNEMKHDEKGEKMSIKNFLFELWNDGNDNIDLKKLLKVLRMSNYITDFVEYNDKKYFDVVFLEQ